MDKFDIEISIKEIFWYVVSKWKSLVAGLLIGAVLFGGFSAIKSIRSNSSKNVTSQIESMQNSMDEEDIEVVDSSVKLFEIHKALKENTKDNYVLNMYPNHVNTTVIQYYINSDYTMNYGENIAVDYTSTIAEAYKSYVTGLDMKKQIVDLGIEGINTENIGYLVSSYVNSRVLYITVKTSDKETTKKITDTIENAVNKYVEKVNSSIGSHSIELMNMDNVDLIDLGIADVQTKINTSVKNALSSLESSLKQLNSEQKKLYDLKVKEIESLDSEDETVESKPQIINKKKIILGAFLGAFVVIVVYICIFVIGDKARNKETIAKLLDTELVQYVTDRKIKKSDRKRFGYSRTADLYEYVSKIINDFLRKHSISDVSIASSVDMSDDMKNCISNVIKNISDVKFTINEAAIGNSIDTLNDVLKTGNVLFVEKMDAASTKKLIEINKEMNANGVKIVGAVVVI